MPVPSHLRAIGTAWRLLRLRELRLGRFPCALCGRPRLHVRLRADAIGTRCVVCRGSAVHGSIAAVVEEEMTELGSVDAYELSARGPFHEFLSRRCRSLVGSELLEGVEPGEHRGGVRCEDVARLTFADASFDLVTSTEVFEHVADDHAGFREVRRALRPGGRTIFTVPLREDRPTEERARRRGDGSIEHLLEPEYHGDPIRGHRPVLAFRTYGRDLIGRLLESGFESASIVRPRRPMPWNEARPVVVARTPGS